MRIWDAVCFPAAAPLAVAGLLFGSPAALGQAAPASGSAASAANLVLIGPPTGDPEKDSLGLAVPPPVICLAPRFSERPQLVGTATGDPEKDSIGYVVISMEPCLTALWPH